MQDPGSRLPVQDPGSRLPMLDPGSWLPVQDPGSCLPMQEFGALGPIWGGRVGEAEGRLFWGPYGPYWGPPRCYPLWGGYLSVS